MEAEREMVGGETSAFQQIVASCSGALLTSLLGKDLFSCNDRLLILSSLSNLLFFFLF